MHENFPKVIRYKVTAINSEMSSTTRNGDYAPSGKILNKQLNRNCCFSL